MKKKKLWFDLHDVKLKFAFRWEDEVYTFKACFFNPPRQGWKEERKKEGNKGRKGGRKEERREVDNYQ